MRPSLVALSTKGCLLGQGAVDTGRASPAKQRQLTFPFGSRVYVVALYAKVDIVQKWNRTKSATILGIVNVQGPPLHHSVLLESIIAFVDVGRSYTFA